MKRMQGIADLFGTLDAVVDNAWIYTNLEQWERQPESAVFYLIAEEEIDVLEDEGKTVENSAGETIPASLGKEDVETWLDVQTLRAIAQVISKNVEAPDAAILIRAIDHYREHDAFLEA